MRKKTLYVLVYHNMLSGQNSVCRLDADPSRVYADIYRECAKTRRGLQKLFPDAVYKIYRLEEVA